MAVERIVLVVGVDDCVVDCVAVVIVVVVVVIVVVFFRRWLPGRLSKSELKAAQFRLASCTNGTGSPTPPAGTIYANKRLALPSKTTLVKGCLPFFKRFNL